MLKLQEKNSKRTIIWSKNVIWDVYVYNIVISKLVNTKNNSKYLIGYSDEDIRPFVLLLPEMNRYVKTFKDKTGNNNNNLMLLRINYNRLI